MPAPRSATLVFPHQLFHNLTEKFPATDTFWIEDPLYFSQYPFHRQKLMLHRASMRWHFDHAAVPKGGRKHYVEAHTLPSSQDLAQALVEQQISEAHMIDPEDDFLSRRIGSALHTAGIRLTIHPSPNFITPIAEIERWTEGKKKYFFTNFYIEQRNRLRLLLDEDGKPVGGKWSFDTDNRKKLPKEIKLPAIENPAPSPYSKEASEYIRHRFPHAIGDDLALMYPFHETDAHRWLLRFLDERLAQFGDFEDAIDREASVLFHSVLTPMLNIGLIAPETIIEEAMKRRADVPLNSLEGFLRQVIGWREYMRLVYRKLGRLQRTCNYWGHHRPMPQSFYNGTTGIEPVDVVIRRTLRTGYCHHIERLMILGNFMLLCEIDPDAIYQWFMELFVDSYDWVMVPNVYGMSQHADGGMITTKPYISGSSYVLKMSNFKKGDWCEVWDGLYWRFMHRHRSFFERNPRMSVMTKQLDKMGPKFDRHLEVSEGFLQRLQ
jgi:deoxyribodipyrimidine photolyase-related protein